MHSLLGDVLADVHRVGVQLNYGDSVTSEKKILIEDTLNIFSDRQTDRLNLNWIFCLPKLLIHSLRVGWRTTRIISFMLFTVLLLLMYFILK